MYYYIPTCPWKWQLFSGTWLLGGGWHATGQRVGVDPPLAALLGPRAGVDVASEVCGIHHWQTVQGGVLIICSHGNLLSIQKVASLYKKKHNIFLSYFNEIFSIFHRSIWVKNSWIHFCKHHQCGWRWGSVCRARWADFDTRHLFDGHALRSRDTPRSCNVNRSTFRNTDPG